MAPVKRYAWKVVSTRSVRYCWARLLDFLTEILKLTFLCIFLIPCLTILTFEMLAAVIPFNTRHWNFEYCYPLIFCELKNDIFS